MFYWFEHKTQHLVHPAVGLAAVLRSWRSSKSNKRYTHGFRALRILDHPNIFTRILKTFSRIIIGHTSRHTNFASLIDWVHWSWYVRHDRAFSARLNAPFNEPYMSSFGLFLFLPTSKGSTVTLTVGTDSPRWPMLIFPSLSQGFYWQTKWLSIDAMPDQTHVLGTFQ